MCCLPTETEVLMSPLIRAWNQGIAAARHNRKPAIFLWLFGIALILSYFYVPPVTNVLESVRELKQKWGLLFAAISTATFGGLIPYVITRWFVRDLKYVGWIYLVSNLIFWALKGIEVDLLYIFQSWMFGNEVNVQTVLSKVAFDQFVFMPLLGGLNMVLFYLWRDCGFSCSRFRKSLGKNWYWNKILPVLISNWFVWIPACAIVYCLPLGLQLPIQNLVLCFWVLIVAFMTESQEKMSTSGAEDDPV